MLKRIVKMSFDPEKTEDFVKVFKTNASFIRGKEGCHRLELWRDQKAANVFFTYSWWENEEALNNYRHSDLFRGVWAETKAMFNDAPQVWSVDTVEIHD